MNKLNQNNHKAAKMPAYEANTDDFIFKARKRCGNNCVMSLKKLNMKSLASGNTHNSHHISIGDIYVHFR